MPIPPPSTAGSDVLEFREEPGAAAPQAEAAPWRVLIADDDVDVHVATKFALRGATFQGRPLAFLHAYSADEALAILKTTPDIALVLLDVIMETPEAGLRVARAVREELGNGEVRIVLRTGQPGQSQEHSVIVDYDINDYWSKADLTTRKLFTTVIASLRAYAELKAAQEARRALQRELAEARKVQATFDRHALVLTLDRECRITDVNERVCEAMGQPRSALVGQPVAVLQPEGLPQLDAIVQALREDGGWAGDLEVQSPAQGRLRLRSAALAFRDDAGVPYQYVAVATPLDPA
jgi:PAS domain-containing protein